MANFYGFGGSRMNSGKHRKLTEELELCHTPIKARDEIILALLEKPQNLFLFFTYSEVLKMKENLDYLMMVANEEDTI